MTVIFCWSKVRAFFSALEVNEFVQKDILNSVRVTLGINCFGNGIGCEGGDFAISKLNINFLESLKWDCHGHAQ